MKEENKKTTKKTANTKKTTTAKKTTKVTKTKTQKPVALNETVKVEETPVIKVNPNTTTCKYCGSNFENGLTVCPFCRRKQNPLLGASIIAVLLVGFIMCICIGYLVSNANENKMTEEEYKNSTQLVSYEELVRVPKEHKDKDIQIYGTVVSVDGYDVGFGNEMMIVLNANLFENGTEQLIHINFTDKDYAQGFIAGDLITVYGKYVSINGNIPEIDAKYVIFGN